MAALYASEENMSEKKQPNREVRSFPFEVDEFKKAQNGRSDDFIIKGHAAVYNTWTDLGVFKERVAKGAFDNVLSRDPHVLHLIDHDTSKVLSSTRNKTLELRSDPKGLHMWSKVAPTSYASDLRVLMERKDVDQSSFAFTVANDDWNEKTVDGKTVVERTIHEVGELFDVTTTAMGAYPTTDSQVAMRTLESARAAGKLPDSHPAETPEDAAPPEAVEETESPPEDRADSQESTAAQEHPVVSEDAALFAMKAAARKAATEAQRRRIELAKEIFGYEDHATNREGETGS